MDAENSQSKEKEAKKAEFNEEAPKNSPPVEGCPSGRGGYIEEYLPGRGGRASKNYFSLPYNANLRDKAKELRKAGNLSEVLLWQQLKNRQFKGYDFDRQKVIGNYIVDFFCTNCRVVLEIDGRSHDHKIEYDAERDTFLTGLGLKVIHILAKDILHNLDGVMKMLGSCSALDHPGAAHHPSTGGEWTTPVLRTTPPREGNGPPRCCAPPLHGRGMDHPGAVHHPSTGGEWTTPVLRTTPPREGNEPPRCRRGMERMEDNLSGHRKFSIKRRSKNSRA